MPRSYRVQRRIDAPPARVWAVLTDLEGYDAWNRAVVSVQGELVPGRKIALVSTVAPGRTFRLTVDQVEPPRRMVWTDGMPLGLFRGTRTFTLEPEGPAACTFTMEESFTGLLAPLISKVVPDLTESFRQWADGLAAATEAASAGPAGPAGSS